MSGETSDSCNGDPIIPIIDDIAVRLRHHAAEPGAVLSCADLMGLVGERAYTLALMLFALLNLLPGPPGYNFLMALAMFAVSLSMLRRRPMSFGARFGRLKLPIRVIEKLLGALSAIVRWAAKASQPRWRGLTGDAAMPFVALLGLVLSLVNMAPIPFANLIPSVGLAVVCMGVLNQDGLAVLAGSLIGAVGTILTLVAAWLLLVIAFAIGEIVEQAVEGDTT